MFQNKSKLKQVQEESLEEPEDVSDRGPKKGNQSENVRTKQISVV